MKFATYVKNKVMGENGHNAQDSSVESGYTKIVTNTFSQEIIFFQTTMKKYIFAHFVEKYRKEE